MNPPAEPLTLEVQLRALGYDVPDGDTPASFDAWRAEVLRDAERHVRADGGVTWVASGRSGASVAIFDDAHGVVRRIVPFFVSSEACTVVHRGAEQPDEVGSGALAVSVLGAGPSGAAVSTWLWTPHMAAWAATMPPGAMLEVTVGAVGAQCAVASAEAASDDPFEPLGGAGFARLHGTVRAHLMRHNDVTRQAFETAVVDCGGVDVTVAVDPAALPRPFHVGDVIAVTARVCGPVRRHVA